MASVERVVLVCDHCGADQDVTEHRLNVDGHSWRIDACAKCWRGHFRKLLKPLTSKGYGVRVRGKGSRAKAPDLRAV
jgi:hypothetical protein